MKTLNTVSTILFIIIIMPLIGVIVPTGSVHFMTISGVSMEPTISESDIIVVTHVDTSQLAVGDIISYRHLFENAQRPATITHRIVGVADGGYRTKGDSHAQADEYTVAPEDVVGIMRYKIPYLGMLVHFADTAAGLVVLVLAPALLIIGAEVHKIMKYKKGTGV